MESRMMMIHSTKMGMMMTTLRRRMISEVEAKQVVVPRATNLSIS
jgi:hypothetical protein